jgi:hypothetical protein
LNLFRLVSNDPINRIDPLGLVEDLGDGLLIHRGSSGTPRVIAGGTVLRNQMEVNYANYQLSGDQRYLSEVYKTASQSPDPALMLALTAQGVEDSAAADKSVLMLGAMGAVSLPGGEQKVPCPARPLGRMTPTPRTSSPTVDPLTGQRVQRFVVDSRGNIMIEPQGGMTVPWGRHGLDTHTLYPNRSAYQRLDYSHGSPHGHGHLPGMGPGRAGTGPSIDTRGNVVPYNTPDAHWQIR